MATKAYQLGLDLLASCFLYELAHWLGSFCDVHRSFQLLPPENSSSSWVNSNSAISDCSWYWFFCPEICCKLMCHCGKLKEAAQKEDCQQWHLNWSPLFQKCIFEPYQLYVVHNRGSLKRQTVILGRYSLSFFHNVHGKYTINRTGFKYFRFFKSTV